MLGITVARVPVRKDRPVKGTNYRLKSRGHFRHRNQTQVWQPKTPRYSAPTGVDRLGTHVSRDRCAQTIVDTGQDRKRVLVVHFKYLIVDKNFTDLPYV